MNGTHRRWQIQPSGTRSLAEQIQDRLARGDGTGEAVLAQAKIERHAQGVVDRGAEVLRPHRPVLHVRADLVGLAVDHAAANAAAGKDGGIARRPVLTPGELARV